jgi:hypothetical protein
LKSSITLGDGSRGETKPFIFCVNDHENIR